MKILVTGAAGFVGSFVARRRLERGDEVVGLDNLNEYYDVRLKHARLREAGIVTPPAGGEAPSSLRRAYRFVRLDLADRDGIAALFARERFDLVCHLAAQAGVRYSIDNPAAYIDSNLVGFLSVLEGCRRSGVKALTYASSSSVYGLNESMPFSTRHNVDHPVSLYAATKKSNELMAHTYAHLYGLPTTGLRFFTVYGPWGRPDMAYYLFADRMMAGKPIDVFNNGEMSRDFTYIDDIVEGILRVMDRPAAGEPSWSGAHPDPSRSRAPYRVYNIGRGSPVRLLEFIEVLEAELGVKAQKRFLAMQPGDVVATWADVSDLERDTGYKPVVDIREGIRRFVAWYREYRRS
jgi:UDP-glucuronate 4-epimerase